VWLTALGRCCSLVAVVMSLFGVGVSYARVLRMCVCLVGNNFCLPFSAPASLRLLPIHLFELQVSFVGNL
jgi:hypothetical protein